MIASLPMYDWPEVREATDAWWAAIAGSLGIAANLDRDCSHFAAWRRSDLLFSQTCGYPFTHEFKDKLTLVATPHYGVDGCEGPNYRSILFAREKLALAEFRDSHAAVNSPDSMSGMLALQLVFAPLAHRGVFFASAVETGSHLNSLRAVRSGVADVCAIDAVCVALAKRYRPADLAGLVEIARSPPVPSLPYVTVGGNPETIRAALATAFADPALRSTRDQLFLTGYSVLATQAYGRITILEDAMKAAGGLKLL
jgi:ABC-type phosphate/phosphonate transport system substrate-binding protein